MKTFTQFLTALLAASIFAAGCVNEDPAYRENPGEKPEEGDLMGFVTLNKMQMRVVFEVQSDDTGDETNKPKATSATRTEPDLTDYIVEIFDAQGVSVKKTTYGELQLLTEPLALPVGTYTLQARSKDQIADTGWDNPAYIGSKEFSVRKDESTSIDHLVCTLANIKVTLVVAADLAAKLSDDTKATVSLGTKSEAFVLGETRAAYFMPDAETNSLKFRLTGKFAATGTDVEFSKTISGVKAGQWRKITLVITYADKGNIKFDIQVDSFTLDDEIVVDGTSSLGQWEPIYNEIDPNKPTMTWTGNDFEKTFQLMADMFDDRGNCSEPFELVLTAPNGVETFQVEINSTNEDFMDGLALVSIPPTFDLCTITDPAASILRGFGFPVGDDVQGVKAKTFYIGGQLPSMLYAFEGTHTFRFSVSDAMGLVVEKTLTILVDKATEGPSILWEGHDLSLAYELAVGMVIELQIGARTGIKALEVTIDSETLTPELGTLDPPLPANFDLCTVSGSTAATLSSFGFPIGDEVLNQTQVQFSLTKFVELLLLFSGEHDFIIQVTDNNGGVTQKTLRLVNPN